METTTQSYRVLKKQERWVETIIYDVESPEQALEYSATEDDWEECYADYTGEYEIENWITGKKVKAGNEFNEGGK